ncbi:MAG TPA: IclR family transcriptional regulator [Micromonosporaceae bacterium]|jgi:IclR family acetate operon transcriptional repressor
MKPASEGSARSGAVQSVERAFDLLELLTDAGGSQGLTQLSEASGLPLPTIHRLMATLTQAGYVRRESSRRYTLGPRLVRIGEAASRVFGTWATPSLRHLVDLSGESANLAMLDGDGIVYVAQAPSPHAMRMFTEPGRRVMAHCTGVGKAILAQMPADDVRTLLERTGMPALTPRTITDPGSLIAQLAEVRDRGYAVDDGEQEVGVRCVAMAVPEAPGRVAISVSGPQARISYEDIGRIVPILTQIRSELESALAGNGA